VHYENDESFKITHSILEDLIQSAEEEITSHLRNISVIHDEGFEIVERATVDIAVNEYPVSDPLSLQGRILDLSHVIGAIPKDILIAIHEAQDKLFPRTELRAHTYMLVMYCVLRDLFPTVGSICIIDVTSEATEFGIVEHNLLAENLFIPFGSSTFIRALAEETGKPISEAEMYLTDQNTLSTTDAELEETRAKYQESVTSAFSDLLSRRMIPSNIIITAQPKYQAFFKAMLEQTLQTVQGKNLRFIEVDPHIINEIASENEPDVYLALSARFFHKLHGCGEMNPH
jgi:cell division ATPase FtsA